MEAITPPLLGTKTPSAPVGNPPPGDNRAVRAKAGKVFSESRALSFSRDTRHETRITAFLRHGLSSRLFLRFSGNRGGIDTAGLHHAPDQRPRISSLTGMAGEVVAVSTSVQVMLSARLDLADQAAGGGASRSGSRSISGLVSAQLLIDPFVELDVVAQECSLRRPRPAFRLRGRATTARPAGVESRRGVSASPRWGRRCSGGPRAGHDEGREATVGAGTRNPQTRSNWAPECIPDERCRNRTCLCTGVSGGPRRPHWWVRPHRPSPRARQQRMRPTPRGRVPGFAWRPIGRPPRTAGFRHRMEEEISSWLRFPFPRAR